MTWIWSSSRLFLSFFLCCFVCQKTQASKVSPEQLVAAIKSNETGTDFVVTATCENLQDKEAKKKLIDLF
jgi:hypothetical protein